MPRSALLFLCLAGGALAIGWALLAPAHFRSVDERVLERVNQGKPRLVDFARGITNKTVAALLSQAAEQLQLPRREGLVRYVDQLPLARHEVWHIRIDPGQPVINSFILNPNQRLQEVRKTNTAFEASVVLRTAGLTNLTHFSPSGTAAGQPFEASILVTAAILKSGGGRPELQSNILQMMGRGDPAEIESFYLDVLALARRFNWEQMLFLLNRFSSGEAMGQLAETLRHFENDLPVLFSAAALAENAGEVAEYVMKFGAEGVQDLELALSYGKGAVDHLVKRQAPVWGSDLRDRFLEYEPFYTMYRPLLYLSVNWPTMALIIKYELIFVGGFLLALALKFTGDHRETEFGYEWFSQMRLARQALVGVLMIMLVIALGEPYLAQGDQKVEPMPKINFSVALGSVAPAQEPGDSARDNSMIDQYTYLALGMFLVLQGIVYAICLLKLGEIRKQPLTSAMKLRLLDNEENLFDAGLYLGLFGTVASLIFLAMGILKPSLVAAYSSTLFGILFVAILKIGHVRPYKRRLLLEIESQTL